VITLGYVDQISAASKFDSHIDFEWVAFPKFEKHSVYQGYPNQELELAWSRLLDGGGTCSFSFPNLAIRVQRAVR
jgi:hypothetical protein